MCNLPAAFFCGSQAIANCISAVSLVISAVTLVFLIIYVRATRKIAEASVEQARASVAQVEASFRPAVVAESESSSTTAAVSLRNIGKGPAMQIEWSIPNSVFKGKIPYLEPTSYRNLHLPEGGPKVLTNAALKGGKEKASIECTYRSISGRQYSSSSDFDFDEYHLVTRFREDELP